MGWFQRILGTPGPDDSDTTPSGPRGSGGGTSTAVPSASPERTTSRIPEPGGSDGTAPLPSWMERSAPGIAALLDGAVEGGEHTIVDLGTAASSSLEVYRKYGPRIRFAEVRAAARSPEGWDAVIRALPPQPGHPYDLVFAWDVFDRLYPQEGPRLMEHILAITAPGARLHAVVESSERATTAPLRFALLGLDRVRYRPVGPERPARPPRLPAEVERLLHPFEVMRAFTLKGGLREYVAVRRDAS